MNNVVNIQSRRFSARSRGAGAFSEQAAAAAVQAIDYAAIAQREKAVSRTTLATVTTAFLLAAAIGAFGMPGLI